MDQFLPIREISRLTGINTVTLRAWERRYGLLKPQRTEKGHRLYTQEDLQRIQQVQYWLNKGLSISKVNELVQTTNQTEAIEVDSIWGEKQQQLYLISLNMNRRQLDKEIEILFSEYPVELLADNLILPLLNQLRQDQFPHISALAFFTQVFEEQLFRMQYRQRQTARGKKILVIMATKNEEDLIGLMLNYGLLINGYQSEVMAHLNQNELEYTLSKINPDFICLVGYQHLDSGLLQSQVSKLISSNKPLMLVGAIAEYLQANGQSQEINSENLLLAGNFQNVMSGLGKM